ITAGTWTTADSSTRTGRVTLRRTTRRASASRHAGGTGRVPTLLSRRVTNQPEARRIERITTPATHATTIHGSAGSRSARRRIASDGPDRPAAGIAGSVPAWGGRSVAPRLAPGAGAVTAPASGPAPARRTAVPTGPASMRISVLTARA